MAPLTVTAWVAGLKLTPAFDGVFCRFLPAPPLQRCDDARQPVGVHGLDDVEVEAGVEGVVRRGRAGVVAGRGKCVDDLQGRYLGVHEDPSADPTGQILQRRSGAAIRDMGDIDADRDIEQNAAHMRLRKQRRIAQKRI